MNEMSLRGAGNFENPQTIQFNQQDEVKFQLKEGAASTVAKTEKEVDETSLQSTFDEYRIESKPAKLVNRGGLLNKPSHGSGDDAKVK